MKVRKNTLWKVPVFCLIFGWLSFYLTVFLGAHFYVVQTPGADGAVTLSVDPVRSAIWNGGLLLVFLLLGGLWAFRSMTRNEIAVSAGILVGFYLIITLAQLWIPGFPISLSVTLGKFGNWQSMVAELLMGLTSNITLSVILGAFTPLLFIPFGKGASGDS